MVLGLLLLGLIHEARGQEQHWRTEASQSWKSRRRPTENSPLGAGALRPVLVVPCQASEEEHHAARLSHLVGACLEACHLAAYQALEEQALPSASSCSGAPPLQVRAS